MIWIANLCGRMCLSYIAKHQVGLYLARSQANEQLPDALGLTVENRPFADKFSRSGRALTSGEMDRRPNLYVSEGCAYDLRQRLVAG